MVFGGLRERVSDRLVTIGFGRKLLWGFGGLLLLLLLYYTIGAIWVHRIDNNPDFTPTVITEGGSRAVDVAAALVEREVDVHHWTANDPFFLPGSVLDNMPNFQQGIVYAVSRFGIALSEQLARARGTSAVDPDVDRASGLLRYPGTIWVFDFSRSLAPTASSESQYRAAVKALRAYNQRVAAGEATFDRRADNLIDTLERFINDLGSSSGTIDDHLRNHGGWPISFTADDVFYQTKGRLYAYYLLLKALGEDFSSVLQERNLTTVWTQMLETAREAAVLKPWVVLNGAPDSQFIPSHLSGQGFLLMRLRTQLREVENVLQK